MLSRKGKHNKPYRGVTLKVSLEERGLGVCMYSSAKSPGSCAEAAKMANRILGMVKRTTVSNDQDGVGLT